MVKYETQPKIRILGNSLTIQPSQDEKRVFEGTGKSLPKYKSPRMTWALRELVADRTGQ